MNTAVFLSPNIATIKLRPLDSSDEFFLFQVYASTRADEMALISWPPDVEEAFLRIQFRAQNQHYHTAYPQAIYQIIEWDGIPVGRIILNRADSLTSLVDISLLPAYRGQGFGTALISSLQAENNSIRLHVLKSNPALNLYQRLGFVFKSEDELYLEMEWSPRTKNMRFTDWSLPWPVLRLPEYRPLTLGHWALKKIHRIMQFGYFQEWQGIEEMDSLFYDNVTWMSTARDEIDSQAPHVATAYGHVVVMGAGLGVVLYNLLSMPQVTRLTLVERDPQVIELLRQSTSFDEWPGAEKLHIEIIDALEYQPAEPVDHLYVDIWATAGKAQVITEIQIIQSHVQAQQLGWWGQELHFLDWLNGSEAGLSAYQAWAAEIGLPLIEQHNPDYIEAVKQVTKSYVYRTHRAHKTGKATQSSNERVDRFEDWTQPAFREQLNTLFRLEHTSLGSITLELIAVSELKEPPGSAHFPLSFAARSKRRLARDFFRWNT
jgi:GNAT superfamily N-acetyltransferase